MTSGGSSTRVVNLTPHKVAIIDPDGGVTAEYEPDGRVARVNDVWVQDVTPNGVWDGLGVPTRKLHDSGVLADGALPGPAEGVVYIVSRLTAMSVPERTDLYFPAEEVRDAAGRIIGCRALGYLTSATNGEWPTPLARRLGVTVDVAGS